MPIPLNIGGNVGAGQATPSAVGASSFAGLRQLGAGLNDLAAVMQEDQDHRDRLKAVELKGRAQREWTEGTASLDPTAENYLQQTEEVFRSVQSDILAEPGITSKTVLDGLELDLSTQAQHGMLASVVTRREAIEKRGLELFDEGTDAVFAQIREDPDGYDAYVQGLAGTAEQIGPAVNPAAMAEKLREAGDMAIAAKVEGLALTGRHDEARAFLKDAEGELTPEMTRQLGRRIREIDNTQEQDFHSATAAAVADIDIAVTDATTTGELDSIRTQIESDPGLWQGREERRASLIQELENKRKALIADGRDTVVALQHLASGTGVDSQKEANLAWRALAKQLPTDAPPEQVAAFTASFAKRSGWLPDDQKRIIENAERVENADQLSAAAQMAARISDVAPGVDTGAGDRNTLTQAFHDVGLEWGEAAQLVISKAPDAATSKARGDEFDDEYKDQDWREWLQDQGVSPARGLFHPFTATAEIPEELAQEAERVTGMFYRLSGDFGAAEKAAAKHLTRTYGVSNVGGAPRLQKYPPERYLPVGDASDETLRTNVLDGLTRRAVEAFGAKVPAVEGGSSYNLVSDEQTRREIESGLRPSYEIRVRSKFGDVMVPVWVETKDGRRTKLRLSMPDATAANKLPEVEAARTAARQKAEDRDNLARITRGVGQATKELATPSKPDWASFRARDRKKYPGLGLGGR